MGFSYLYPEKMEDVRRHLFDYYKKLGKTVKGADLEVACFRTVPFGSKLKGEFCISMAMERWPFLYLEKQGIENYWFTRICRTLCTNKRVYLVGAASAGKSMGLAVVGYNFWASAPNGTNFLVTSTDKESLDSKIWGAVRDLQKEDRLKLGLRVDYEDAIVMEKKANERDIRDAIKAIALPKGSEGEKAIGKVQGRKNQNIIWAPQPITSPVLTPTGWKPMGKLFEGDRIIGSDGSTQIVTKTHTVYKDSVYELTFSDGSKARSTLLHRWTFRNGTRGKKRPTTAPLKYFIGKLNRPATDSKGRPIKRWSLPPSPVVQFHQKHPHKISPYVVGALIGDGSILTSASFYTSESDIAETFQSELPEGHTLVEDRWRNGCMQYHIKGENRKNVVISELKRVGLWGKGCADKFIPHEFLFSSVESRIKLLQGLMDTDGSVTDSTLRYTTISKQLCDDVTDLIRSLGGYADISIDTSLENTKYTVVASYPSLGGIMPFRSVRKIGRCKPYGRNEKRYRRLVKVEEVSWEDVMCITVSNPDGLYITNDYVITHNCDEYAHMDAFVQQARSNLAAAPMFLFWAASNKPEEGDPMYQDAAPDPEKYPMGWETPGLSDMESWETKGGGVCLYFDGEKSPNTLSDQKDDPFPMLTRRDYIETIRKEEGEDGYGWWKYIKSFPKVGHSHDKLIDSNFVRRFKADEDVTWAGSEWTVVAGLDAAWTKGGDACTADFGKVGISHEGVKVLMQDPDPVKLFPVGGGTYEEQLARAFLDHCRKRECHVVAVDISGSGGRLANPVIYEAQKRGWKLEVISVDSAGAPDELENYQVGSIRKTGKELFKKRMDEVWVSYRLSIQEGLIRGLKLTSRAFKELSDRRIDTDEDRRWVLEKKDRYKERNAGRSPDSAESRVLCHYAARKHGLGADLAKRDALKVAEKVREFKDKQEGPVAAYSWSSSEASYDW